MWFGTKFVKACKLGLMFLRQVFEKGRKGFDGLKMTVFFIPSDSL